MSKKQKQINKRPKKLSLSEQLNQANAKVDALEIQFNELAEQLLKIEPLRNALIELLQNEIRESVRDDVRNELIEQLS